MSKLSSSLKALIAAPHARPNTLPASPRVRTVYEALRNEAEGKNVGAPAWLTLSTAATMTMNSPEGLTQLYELATERESGKEKRVEMAELMREVGLKCIGFNGVPRTINCLGAFRSSLPEEIVSSLSTTPTRTTTPQNITSILNRGSSLWDSIYAPFSPKLVSKLSLSHPDLPIFIINHEYGALFSDPPQKSSISNPHQSGTGYKIGRVLTSIVAIACLRAQTGVGPQVTSHIFGLRKAFEDGSAEAEGESEVEGGEWLAGDEGGVWLLGAVDRIVEALGEGRGPSFAPGMEGVRAKL